MPDDAGSLTAEDAAAYLGVSRATLYAYVSRGLVSSLPGEDPRTRARRYPRAALDRLKAQRAQRRDPAAGALRWGAPVLESSLTLIHDGRLWYRGRDACELSRTATLEHVASLLWTGETGTSFFPPAPFEGSPAEGRLGDRLVDRLVAERTASPLSLDRAAPATLQAAGRLVSSLFEAVGSLGDGDLAERLARGWRSPAAGELRAALVLCADHELNASTFTARTVASTDAPIHDVLLAALCALEGRRHGGVTRVVEQLLDDAVRLGADEACRRQLAQTGWIPGFFPGTHPLYPDGDPRAAELLRRLALRDDDPIVGVAAQARELGGTPSIDYALAALGRAVALPEDAPFALFALGRSIGWVAHALEAVEAGALIRPRARYTGPPPAA